MQTNELIRNSSSSSFLKFIIFVCESSTLYQIPLEARLFQRSVHSHNIVEKTRIMEDPMSLVQQEIKQVPTDFHRDLNTPGISWPSATYVVQWHGEVSSAAEERVCADANFFAAFEENQLGNSSERIHAGEEQDERTWNRIIHKIF